MIPDYIEPRLSILGSTQVISDEQFDDIQGVLDGNIPVYSAGRCSFVADFANKMRIYLDVVLVPDDDCTGNSYIETSFYDDERELVRHVDPIERLDDDDIVIVHDNITYILTILRGSTYDEIMRKKSYQ
jgi:hypothetical protein